MFGSRSVMTGDSSGQCRRAATGINLPPYLVGWLGLDTCPWSPWCVSLASAVARRAYLETIRRAESISGILSVRRERGAVTRVVGLERRPGPAQEISTHSRGVIVTPGGTSASLSPAFRARYAPSSRHPQA